jgi:hypothetical protein
MARTLGQAAFPPLRFPQLASLVTFALEIAFLKVISEKVRFLSAFHDPGLHRFLSESRPRCGMPLLLVWIYKGAEKQSSGRQPRRAAYWKAQHMH